MVQSKSVIYKKVPNGFPVPGEDLVVESSEVDISTAPEGSVVLKVLSVSVDPYMRGRLRAPEVKSYSPPFTLNEPIEGGGIAKVLESSVSDFQKGDIVSGSMVHSEYVIYNSEKIQATRLKKLQNPYNLPIDRFVGVLGMPGLTAYSSLYDIGDLHKNEKETIFISAASGAVGSLVGQLAKREGLRVVGSAGSDEKVKYLIEELKFDAAFNYKTEPPKEALAKYIPEGLDIYYDNVGGETLEAAIDNAKTGARFIECGMISQYNRKQGEEAYGIRNLMSVVGKRLKIEGFIVGDIAAKYMVKFQTDVQKWLHEGQIVYNEDVTVGIDHEAEGFVKMLNGKNFGKAVIRYAEA
ncbi:Zeta-crystallin [Dactylellina cionopaga]|nr:Zeta-crystallin [Dactylellina cionopaga]